MHIHSGFTQTHIYIYICIWGLARFTRMLVASDHPVCPSVALTLPDKSEQLPPSVILQNISCSIERKANEDVSNVCAIQNGFERRLHSRMDDVCRKSKLFPWILFRRCFGPGRGWFLCFFFFQADTDTRTIATPLMLHVECRQSRNSPIWVTWSHSFT